SWGSRKEKSETGNRQQATGNSQQATGNAAASRPLRLVYGAALLTSPTRATLFSAADRKGPRSVPRPRHRYRFSWAKRVSIALAEVFAMSCPAPCTYSPLTTRRGSLAAHVHASP